MKKKIINIFSKQLKLNKKEILAIKRGKLNNFKLGIHKNWDSLKHIEILNEISKKTKITINKKNFSNFVSLEKILQYLK